MVNQSFEEDADIKEHIQDQENLATSLSSDRLRIDPNYKWLLKDLNLNNDTRVIDVTDILEDKKENEEKNEVNEDNRKVIEEDEVQLQEENLDDPIKLFYPNNEHLVAPSSLNNTSRDLDDITINTNNSDLKPEEIYDEFEEDHKNDENCITRLYEKLIKPSYDSDKQNDTIEHHESDYENPLETCQSRQESGDSESDDNNKNKYRSKFGKSFEASLSSMDNLIDRLDNGMKLKRNKGRSVKLGDKSLGESENSNKIVESLKQEWSNMFSKLEHDYKNKLDEQQKLNDMKLKSLHDEIKKCIVEQEKFINKSPNTNLDENNLKATMTISNNPKSVKMIDVSTATTDSFNPNIINDNAKYISNLRAELKSKHARHIQDLKDYYEKEIEDFRYRLDLYVEKYGSDPNNQSETLKENQLQQKYQQLCEINGDLKDSNATLIHKLVRG